MLKKLHNNKFYNSKFYKTPEEAIYRGLILGETNGAFDFNRLKREDGSLKSLNFIEADSDDRKKVFGFKEAMKWKMS
jgi:hypothetical protein